MALALHASRSASPASELRAIEAILKAGSADGETATAQEIAAQTGMSIQTVRRRLRLRTLIDQLREAFDQSAIPQSIAEAAARRVDREQEMLADQLAAHSRLTLADVRDLAWERSEKAKAELPGELFSDREAPWQTTVRGHIIAGLSALPDDNCPGQLAALLKRALTQAERN
jgi:hypothetical protein